MKLMKKINGISIILLLVLTIASIMVVVMKNNQSMIGSPVKMEFIGEYSFDGSEWKPLSEQSELSAYNGNLIVKGHFNKDITAGARLNYYRNHIGVSMYINGQLNYIDAQTEIGKLGINLMPSMCGKHWTYFITPNISQTDEVELHFINYHDYGNESAYMDMLNTLYISPNTNEVMESYLNPYIKPFHIISTVIIVVAIMLIGAAIASLVLKSNITSQVFKLGLFILFVGGYFLFDTMYIFNAEELLVVRTYGRQLAIMNAVYLLGIIIKDSFSNKKRTFTSVVVGISFVVNLLILLHTMVNKVLLYDMQLYWVLSQLIICPILFVCIVHEILKTKKGKNFEQFCFAALILGILLDIANIHSSTYMQGVFSKSIFIITFILYIFKLVKNIILNYHATIKNEKLQQELESSKIDIMLSQIQPHFLYNSLTAVMCLCDTNPRQAKESIADFADYLRGNLDSLKEQKLISFEKELEHVKKYLKLEELRFKNNLQIKYDIKVMEFMIPALTIQPLVENAIKHGVAQKMGVGTVIISTRETEKEYVIEVKDNGAGFEHKEASNNLNSHIGINNVRTRLEMMIHARLEIKSEAGCGTTVSVFIPKK